LIGKLLKDMSKPNLLQTAGVEHSRKKRGRKTQGTMEELISNLERKQTECY
jgi:hypothetical protein